MISLIIDYCIQMNPAFICLGWEVYGLGLFLPEASCGGFEFGFSFSGSVWSFFELENAQ